MSTLKFDNWQDRNGTRTYAPCTAWVNFNGTGTVAIRDSLNVSSITDNGTGDYTVNFTTAMVNTNYSVTVTGGNTIDNFVMPVGGLKNGSSGKLTDSCTIALTTTPDLGTGPYDSPEISVQIFGGI